MNNNNNKKDAKAAYRPYGYTIGKNVPSPRLFQGENEPPETSRRGDRDRRSHHGGRGRGRRQQVRRFHWDGGIQNTYKLQQITSNITNPAGNQA